jgi:hypothetical protein
VNPRSLESRLSRVKFRTPLLAWAWAAFAAQIFSSAAACRSQAPSPTAETQSPGSAAPTGPATAAGTAAPPRNATVVKDDSRGASVDEPLAGAQFQKQLRKSFRLAGCSGDDALLPRGIEPAVLDQHCSALREEFDEYKRDWLDVAKPFIAKLRPEAVPTTVVYPFGGGDLVSALATYPDAVELTTISLEIAGDIRAIDTADPHRLASELMTLRNHLGKLFLKAHSRTDNLGVETKTAIPGEVAFTMAALAIHGYEPDTLRYFSFNPDGTLRWLTEAEIAQNESTPGRAGPFANAEIRFKKPGDSRVRVLRHIAFELSDANLRRSPGLMKHLESKGKVSAMTKAASHLLWDDAHFSVIRDYLMTHTDWMISDTTGVPPRIAAKYGFVQDAYGQYEWPEPFGTVNLTDVTAFRELFRTSSPITFRYGYPDSKAHGHIVVTHKPEVGNMKLASP